MLRKENDKIAVIENKISELSKDIELLKIQMKAAISKDIAMNLVNLNDDGNTSNSLAAVKAISDTRKRINQAGYTMQLIDDVHRQLAKVSSRNNSPRSFSYTQHQRNYQHARTLSNIFS